jgi:MinD-like ATPase involved in chromosome partitioning or flagellar assembly
MDAYATIKILAKLCGKHTIHLIVNQAGVEQADRTGAAVAMRLQQVASKFLTFNKQAAVNLNLIGSIPTDAAVMRATSRQLLLKNAAPEAPSMLAIDQIAKILLSSLA